LPPYLGSKSAKKTEIKNGRSPTTTKQTTSGESNLIGTRTEQTLTVTEKKNRKQWMKNGIFAS